MGIDAAVWCQRSLSEDEFNTVRNTPMYRRMLINRLRITTPLGQSASRRAWNEIAEWLSTNCGHLYYQKTVMPGQVDIFFLDATDAAAFKLVWAGRQYADEG